MSQSKSPLPRRVSAPASPRTMSELVAFVTRRQTFIGRFDFIKPVTTVPVGALCRQHKMNSSGAPFSSNSCHRLFELFFFVASGQYQIGEFVEDENDKRKVDHSGLKAFGKADVTITCENVISTVHFRCGGAQNCESGLDIRGDRLP